MGLTIKYGENGPTGFRVTRMVEGELRQRYFQTDDYESANATASALTQWFERGQAELDRKRQIESRPREYTHERYQTPRRTAIIGLKIDISHDTRRASEQWYPYITIGHGTHENRRVTRRIISPKSRTLYEAWRESCRVLAGFKGLDAVPYAWYKAEPKPEQFVALREYMIEKGNDVPYSAIAYIVEGQE